MAESKGFEPLEACTSTVFETAAQPSCTPENPQKPRPTGGSDRFRSLVEGSNHGQFHGQATPTSSAGEGRPHVGQRRLAPASIPDLDVDPAAALRPYLIPSDPFHEAPPKHLGNPSMTAPKTTPIPIPNTPLYPAAGYSANADEFLYEPTG